MKKLLPIWIFLMIACSSKSQPIVVKDTSQVVTIHTDSAKQEFESEFPGGQAGWIRFLNANLVYPEKAV
ncbi:MAG TPA: hypothetical protein VFV08_13065, partial [Puia sp.]|nr:hypothetical protein [Puia sp.]